MDVPVAQALDLVYGYAAGIGLTRRDRQRDCRDRQISWEAGKSFDASAPCGPITPRASVGDLAAAELRLDVNGEARQRTPLALMIWNVAEIISHLSTDYRLRPGDLITQKNMQKVPDERLDIQRTRDAITAVMGQPPRGWLGPGLTETWETPDLLVEEGYEYVCDWVLDDQPTQLRTRTTPIVNVPYTQECNDVAMMLIQHHSAEEYRRRAVDQFDQLLADARADDSARVMALVVHPYIMAAPHRLKYLDQALEYIRGHAEATFLTGEQIHDWYQGQTASE